MPVIDIFSKRQRKLRGELPDVYQYNDLPSGFRAQTIHVFRDVLGGHTDYSRSTEEVFSRIHDILCREYGLLTLSAKHTREGEFKEAVFTFFMSVEEVERALDVIELVLQFAISLQDDWKFQRDSRPSVTSEEAIEEVNQRFRENGIGFQFESGEIVRVDSQVIHQEVVRPALYLLAGDGFEMPNQEFLRAHEHFRHGRLREAIAEAAKVLESTLKVIAKRRNWPISESDTAKKLIEIAFGQNLLPEFLRSHFTALRATLETGVPTIRNRVAGHGQGTKANPVPIHLAAYALHLTAAATVFLCEAAKEST